MQNSGGCFPPPPGYFQRVREICDRHDVLLVSDEVICAFGRLGTMFGSDKFGYVPDMITCAKGMTSGYSPIGACIVSDRIAEPFWHGDDVFPHGYTFGGHPVSAAVAMANLDIFEREGLNQHVLDNEGAFRSTLEKLHDLPIVGDVRGDGYFYGIELVKDKATKETFDDDESDRLLRGFLSKALFDAGLYCRADDRGDPVVQLAPPLIIGQPRVRRDRADPALGAHRGLERASEQSRSAEPLTLDRGARDRRSVALVAARAHRATESLHSMIYFAPEADEELTAVGLRPGRMRYFASRLRADGCGVASGSPRRRSTTSTRDRSPSTSRARGRSPRRGRSWSARLRRRRPGAAPAARRRRRVRPRSRELAGLAREARPPPAAPKARPLYAAHADLPWPDEPHLVMWHAATLLREYARRRSHRCAARRRLSAASKRSITHCATGRGFTEDAAKLLRGWSDEQWTAAQADAAGRGA